MRIHPTLLAVALLPFAGGTALSQQKLSAADWHKQRSTKTPVPGAKDKQTALLAAVTKASETVGKPIPGFAPEFIWDRKADAVDLVVYINAGDPYGVCISNLKKGDTLSISSANGACRFSKGDALKKIVSFVGVAATVVAGIEAPEAAPYIPTVEDWVKKNLIPTNTGEQRDAYGKDPGTGDWCQDEGGVIVCLPQAGGVLYRGGDNGSVPKKKARTDDNLPDHVKGKGFFPVAGDAKHNTRKLDQDGEVFLAAWDGAGDFDDNTGCYIVRMKITRGK